MIKRSWSIFLYVVIAISGCQSTASQNVSSFKSEPQEEGDEWFEGLALRTISPPPPGVLLGLASADDHVAFVSIRDSLDPDYEGWDFAFYGVSIEGDELITLGHHKVEKSVDQPRCPNCVGFTNPSGVLRFKLLPTSAGTIDMKVIKQREGRESQEIAMSFEIMR